MQPVRSSALIDALIAEIGRTGSMDITVSQIARRAGMSSALAHHYFGSKNSMFVAAMRHILTIYSTEMRRSLAGVTDPRLRLEIIIRTSFSEENFRPAIVSAWLNFYVVAQKSTEVARLLKVYHRRLQSNLIHELRRIIPEDAASVAEGIASMIDGVYIRWVLRRDGDLPGHPEQLALDYLNLRLAHQREPAHESTEYTHSDGRSAQRHAVP
jgi:TetR/AcrR family transcriptional regulator, transcriptional repressor of bet genes